MLDRDCLGSHEIGCVGDRPSAREIRREQQAADKRNRRRERERESQRVERGGVEGGFGERGRPASERERVEESSFLFPRDPPQINFLFFFFNVIKNETLILAIRFKIKG